MSTFYIRNVSAVTTEEIQQRAAALGVSAATLAGAALDFYASADTATKMKIEAAAVNRQEEIILSLPANVTAATRAKIAGNAAAVLSEEDAEAPAP